ncbi:serine hydrolase domain-containing protein [Rhodanobacter geophilus]|uniref:Serine hydrolase domain-containing protein n=1 Tax=Rhodanobacter geophilus TaxID=3162488 RepID=A0ABV3QKS7_9GAMM
MSWRLTLRLALGMAVMASVSGCVAILVHAGKSAYKALSSPTTVIAGPLPVPDEARKELEEALKHGASGLTAIVMRYGHLVFRLDLGKIAPDEQLPVASASKWMTAALVMSVVDEGKLSLDAPVSRYLPDFAGQAGQVTLRELLAQTSGEGDLRQAVDIRQDPRITLAASAAQIARRPLQDKPGTTFRYGGPGFQVAGAAVEAVTGQRWAALFDERIARPLGMRHTHWEHLPSRGVTPAGTLNPLLQGGVVTTAADYMHFLTMLAQHGRFDGHRILSAQAVDTMETVQTLGRPMAYLPPGMQGHDRGQVQYALGNWCETWSDDRCLLVSSPGATGTFPWIDRRSGLYGIFFVRGRLPRVINYFTSARAVIIQAYGQQARQPAPPATH